MTAGVVNRRLEIIEQVFLVAQGADHARPVASFTCNAERRRITTSMPMPMPTGTTRPTATTGSNDTVQVASDPGSFGWDARRESHGQRDYPGGSKTLRTRDSRSCAPIATKGVQIAPFSVFTGCVP